MDGFDFLRERLTPVVLHPYGGPHKLNAPRDRRKAMELGADLFMLKPDRMDGPRTLYHALSASSEKRKRHSPARAGIIETHALRGTQRDDVVDRSGR